MASMTLDSAYYASMCGWLRQLRAEGFLTTARLFIVIVCEAL